MKLFRLPHLSLLMCAALCGGCGSSGYFLDRGRDAADVFTVTVGRGIGASPRISFVHPGLCVNVEDAGLRGGLFFAGAMGGMGDCFMPVFLTPPTRKLPVCSVQKFATAPYDPHDIAVARGKDFRAVGAMWPPFFTVDFWPKTAILHPYFTQFEAVAGVGFSLCLGLNPGEFVDAVLGWTTLDIYNDDIERIRKETDNRAEGPLVAEPRDAAEAAAGNNVQETTGGTK